MRILIAEDDVIIARALEAALGDCGYVADLVADGVAAQQALLDVEYDLVVLDLGLPRLEGLQVLRNARARQNAVPIFVVTAREGVEQRVNALNIGADDYLVKPFALQEFVARVRALIRRRFNGGIPDLSLGHLRVNLAARRAWLDDQALDLTAREYALLEALLVRQQRVVSRAQLVETLCDWEQELTDNGLDILLHRLRRKLPGSGVQIRTLRGLGYLLEEEQAER